MHWESVKELIFLSERLDFSHIYIERKLTFTCKVIRSSNVVLSNCASVCKRSREDISVCENVVVGNDCIDSYCKSTQMCAVKSKVASIVLA